MSRPNPYISVFSRDISFTVKQFMKYIVKQQVQINKNDHLEIISTQEVQCDVRSNLRKLK